MSDAQLDACRIDFVAYMVAEQAHRDPAYRISIKAHRKGKNHGFDHPAVQIRWMDFKAGWSTSKPPQAAPRVPMTDDEIVDIAIKGKSAESGRDGYVLPISFARAIEAHHGITGVKS